MLTGQ